VVVEYAWTICQVLDPTPRYQNSYEAPALGQVGVAVKTIEVPEGDGEAGNAARLTAVHGYEFERNGRNAAPTPGANKAAPKTKVTSAAGTRPRDRSFWTTVWNTLDSFAAAAVNE
jgi:hypothetical protein